MVYAHTQNKTKAKPFGKSIALQGLQRTFEPERRESERGRGGAGGHRETREVAKRSPCAVVDKHAVPTACLQRALDLWGCLRPPRRRLKVLLGLHQPHDRIIISL